MKKVFLLATLAVAMFSCSGDVDKIDVNDPAEYCWNLKVKANGDTEDSYVWANGSNLTIAIRATEAAYAAYGINVEVKAYKTSKSKGECIDEMD